MQWRRTEKLYGALEHIALGSAQSLSGGLSEILELELPDAEEGHAAVVTGRQAEGEIAEDGGEHDFGFQESEVESEANGLAGGEREQGEGSASAGVVLEPVRPK